MYPGLLSVVTNRTFGVNILAHFYILKAFLPYLLEKKRGHIVGTNFLFPYTYLHQQITMASVLGMIGVAQMSEFHK